MYKRLISLDLPKKQSCFLSGARKTGKSTFLKKKFLDHAYFDLLDTDLFMSYSKRPAIFKEEVLALPKEMLDKPIIIDEVQKVPLLLNEVHWLIENKGLQFILCGSSARKLKRGHANLLGGRAWRYELLPLTYSEISSKETFDLLKALQRGLLPSHYNQKQWKKSLKAYIFNYLQEEIMAEGLARNLSSFLNFFDMLGFCNSELLNYTNISRECGVDAKTVKTYFDILVDTHVGYLIHPYRIKKRREIISATPKFYLFDVGIAQFIAQREIKLIKGSEAGKAFEHFILMELIAYRSYTDKTWDINYWRTKSGLEVDFVLEKGKHIVEVKIGLDISKKDLKGIIAFMEEYSPQSCSVVCFVDRKRVIETEYGNITIFPWQEYLKLLWKEQLFYL